MMRKLENLATARAEKTRVDALSKSFGESVEHYRKAIANERKRLLRDAAKRARDASSDSSSDAPLPPAVAAVAGVDAQHGARA